MAEDRLPFSSPAPTGAIISQFYIALQKCFEMKNGECVFIEIDGDVSLLASNPKESLQAEMKEYFKPLTDSHKNFWNTLNNWLHPSFKEGNYKQLLLITTQSIGINSKFKDWSTLNLENRLEILNQIKEKSEKLFSEKVIKKEAELVKEGKKTEKINPPESLKLMRNILNCEDLSLLKKVIEKVDIISDHSTREFFPSQLATRELKGIAEDNRDKYLNALLGYIINEETYNKGWRITSESFQQMCQDLTQSFVENTVIFPNIIKKENISESERLESYDYDFVAKIRDIEYDEVIHNSITEYWFTFNTISSEFNRRVSKKDSIVKFQQNLKDLHTPLYRKASRGCNSSNVINNSKDFFDDVMGLQTPNFDLYNDTPLIFKNGMFHILANESEHNIHWKLTPDKDKNE
jgi:hypothetical protein